MKKKEKNTSIFYSSDKKNWKRIKYSGLIVIFLFLIFITSFVTILLAQFPPLKPVNFSILNHFNFVALYRVHKQNQKILLNHVVVTLDHLNDLYKKKFMAKNPAAAAMTLAKPLNFVVLDVDNKASFLSLQKNLNSIDVVMPTCLTLESKDGEISEYYPLNQNQVTKYIRINGPEVKIIPIIQDKDSVSKQIAIALSTAATRHKIAQKLLDYIIVNDFDGINIDFESLKKTSVNDFNLFIDEVVKLFHAEKLTVNVSLLPNKSFYDYSKLASIADHIILLVDSERDLTDLPGSVSSLKWYSETLSRILNQVSPGKLVIGLGNYGYEWIEGQPEATDISFAQVMADAKLASAKITFDPASLTPTFGYRDNLNRLHQVWFLDSVTFFNQWLIARKIHPYGIALLDLGKEDPAIWSFFSQTNPMFSLANQLATIDLNSELAYEGQGLITNNIYPPVSGKRKLTLDPTHKLIIDEKYQTLAAPYILNQLGFSNEKKVALTFDDGPNPKYTIAILDILKKTQTPATFFILGLNALDYPELVKREYQQGHEIGNHSFTHPNIFKVSNLRFDMELNSTEMLLENILNKRIRLFRPPYYGPADMPQIIAQLDPFIKLLNQGYIITGADAVSADWLRPGVNKIVENVLTPIFKNQGNIILLHDSGGDRSQTVAALPIIIQELKNQGYQFVTISDLLATSKEDLMPSGINNHYLLSRFGFGFMHVFLWCIPILFLTGIVLQLLRFFVISGLAIYQKHTTPKSTIIESIDQFTVSVIIPAHNEEKVICKTITSLLQAKQPKNFNIIVVNNGSKDNSLKVLTENFGSHPQVKIIDQKEPGKTKALNYGLSLTDSEIIIFFDADTICCENTIMHLVKPFLDEKVGAVAGNVRVGNKINLLTRLQAIEYIVIQNLDRRALCLFNAVPVVPGATGSWRRSAVLQAGGFTADTLAEDSDLTIKIRKLGYAIMVADEGVGITEAPDTINGFLKQRYRWVFGLMQVFWKHKNTLFKPAYGMLGFVGLPYGILYQILLSLIAPFMDGLFLLGISIILLDWKYHTFHNISPSLTKMLGFCFLFMLLDYLIALIAFILDKRESKKLLLWIILERIIYRPLFYYISFKTLFAALRGTRVWWQKSHRKASVKINEMGK